MEKRICQRCFGYHEAPWTSFHERAWDDGQVHCPNTVREGGSREEKMFVDLMKPLVIAKADGPPPWCEFARSHLEKVG